MRSSEFNWPTGLFIIVYHLLLVVALPIFFLHHSVSWQMITISAVLLYASGLGVTVGYHRLYSHPTYRTRPVVEAVILFFATMATQGSALRWSFEHRHHHAFVDTDRDPYSIKKGFWYAHFFWLFQKPQEIDPKVVADLMRNPLLRFQHKHYATLMFATNVLTTLAVGYWMNDYLGAFLFAWLTRLFFLHHFTWFINSLAHTWGARTFCKELSAVDNYIIALLTFGEGYHNYHHTFANDYRNGIRWFHFDPTKWIIWTLHKCGLATDLKRIPRHRIQEKIFAEHKQQLMEKIQSSLSEQKEEWEQKVTSAIDTILSRLREIRDLKDQYYTLKKARTGKKEILKTLNSQIKALNRTLNQEYRNWVDLSHRLGDLTSTH